MTRLRRELREPRPLSWEKSPFVRRRRLTRAHGASFTSGLAKISLKRLRHGASGRIGPPKPAPLRGWAACARDNRETESVLQMNLGDIARTRLITPILAALVVLSAVPQVAVAQEAGSAPPPTTSSALAPQADAASINVSDAATPAAEQAEGSAVEQAPGADAAGYTPLGSEWIKGQPVDGGMDFQQQYSPDGKYAYWMHTWLLLPMMVGVCLLVLFLLLYVIVRYNRRSIGSSNQHNPGDVIWTSFGIDHVRCHYLVTMLPHYERAARRAPVKSPATSGNGGTASPPAGSSDLEHADAARPRARRGATIARDRMVMPVGERSPCRDWADRDPTFGIPHVVQDQTRDRPPERRTLRIDDWDVLRSVQGVGLATLQPIASEACRGAVRRLGSPQGGKVVKAADAVPIPPYPFEAGAE